MGVFDDFCNLKVKNLVDSINKYYSKNRGFIFVHRIDFEGKRFDYYVFEGLGVEGRIPSFTIQFDEVRKCVSISFYNIIRPNGTLFFKKRHDEYYFYEGGKSINSFILTHILSSVVFNYYYLPVIFPPNYYSSVLTKDFYHDFLFLSKNSSPVYVDREGNSIPLHLANDVFNKLKDEFEGEIVF